MASNEIKTQAFKFLYNWNKWTTGIYILILGLLHTSVQSLYMETIQNCVLQPNTTGEGLLVYISNILISEKRTSLHHSTCHAINTPSSRAMANKSF